MPSERIQAALDEFKSALIDEGMDPDTVDAQTRMILPSEVTLGGNYADLQRLGASSLAGNVEGTVPGVVMPPQPITEPVLTSEPDDRTVEAVAQIEGMPMSDTAGAVGATPEQVSSAGGPTPSSDEGAWSGDLDSMTKDELLAEADSRGVPASASMTKAEIRDAIESGG